MRPGSAGRSHELRCLLEAALAKALGEEAEAKASITVALRTAGQRLLPTEPGELLAFVERHLHPQLRERVGATLASSIVDELEATLAQGMSQRSEAQPTRGQTVELAQLPTRPAPAMEQANGVPATSGVRVPIGLYGARTAAAADCQRVLVIDANRIRRVELCRVLVHASWDVTVRDSYPTTAGELRGFDAVITEVDGSGIDEWLDALANDPPSCPIIAWTEHVDRAEAMLRAVGLDLFHVVAKSARVESVVDALDVHAKG